jgi:hypothetical protein
VEKYEAGAGGRRRAWDKVLEFAISKKKKGFGIC